jgi:hypothetical protein
MSFVDELNFKFLEKLKLRVRCKEDGKIYPVKRLDYYNENKWEAIYLTEGEQIKEHMAKGRHYCSSCGQIFYDMFFDQDNGELIVDELVVK